VDTYLPYVNRSEVLIQFANGTEVKGSFFPSQNSVDTGSPSPGAWVFVDGNLMPPPPQHTHTTTTTTRRIPACCTLLLLVMHFWMGRGKGIA
jgi:hypothetical protein